MVTLKITRMARSSPLKYPGWNEYVSMLAERERELWAFAAQVWQQSFADTADGPGLEAMMKLCSTSRWTEESDADLRARFNKHIHVVPGSVRYSESL
jgi:hypothetical protein